MKIGEYSVLLDKRFRKIFFNKAISKFKTQTVLAKYLSSNLNRKVIRENIKGWLKGKHKAGWDILTPISILEEICIINNMNLKMVLEHAIKFNPPWKDPKKINFLVKQNEIKLINKNNKKYLDLTTIIPKTTLASIRSRKNLPLFVNIKKDEIELWSEACWKKSIIKLNRYIELNDLFFIGLALYTSEGTTKGKCNDSISIGNTEPAIINLFFKWIDSFLKDYQCVVRINFNGKVDNKKQIIEFWKNKVHFVKNFKILITERIESGSGLIHNMGTLNIRITNTVLRAFIINLIDKSKKLVLSNKNYSINYLNGLLACEGSVYIKKMIKTVSIGATDKKERLFIKRLLKKLNISYCEGKYDIVIGNWYSFFRLYKYNVFDIPQINNYSKNKRFLEGFKNHRKTKKIINLYPFKNKEFTANDWRKYYNLKSYISAHKYLNPLTKEKFLKFRLLKNRKYFYINPSRLEELNSIWGL